MGFLKRAATAIATSGGSEQFRLANKGINKAVGEAPEQQFADLDGGTKDLLAAQSANAMKTPDQIADEQLQGANEISNAEGMGGLDAAMEKSSGLGGVMPDDFSSALKSRAKKSIDSSGLNLRAQAKLKAGDIKAQRMGQMAQYEGQLHQQLTQKKVASINRASQKKAARAAMIGAIGGAVGTAVGGPVAGAMFSSKPQQQNTGFGEGTQMGGSPYSSNGGMA